ncbi:unnamed protein product [Schistosoma mattheei]|uniref:Uncharacterized protein n=1 Tax=Schistosoma mattheei TaxID=31246 RepID=A0A183PV22_9TREM|nr:unnamed protein product [Schistosoma mattheei]
MNLVGIYCLYCFFNQDLSTLRVVFGKKKYIRYALHCLNISRKEICSKSFK